MTAIRRVKTIKTKQSVRKSVAAGVCFSQTSVTFFRDLRAVVLVGEARWPQAIVNCDTTTTTIRVLIVRTAFACQSQVNIL